MSASTETLFGKQVDLIVITGYSGAGKSEAIAAFEDSGTSASTTCRRG